MQEVAKRIIFKTVETVIIGVSSRILINTICNDLEKKAAQQEARYRKSMES